MGKYASKVPKDLNHRRIKMKRNRNKKWRNGKK